MTRRRGPPGHETAAPPDPQTALTGSGAPRRRGRPDFRSGLTAGRLEAAGGPADSSVSRPRRSRSPSPRRSPVRARAHTPRAPRRPESDDRRERGRWRRARPFLPGGRGSGRAPGRGGARRGGARPQAPRERQARVMRESGTRSVEWRPRALPDLRCFLAATICVFITLVSLRRHSLPWRPLQSLEKSPHYPAALDFIIPI